MLNGTSVRLDSIENVKIVHAITQAMKQTVFRVDEKLHRPVEAVNEQLSQKLKEQAVYAKLLGWNLGRLVVLGVWMSLHGK